jgi:hypothetical protein
VSGARKLLSGVPQGSVLGPLLLVYINNVFQLNIKGHQQYFADDGAIVYSCDSFGALKTEMQGDVDLLTRFFSKLNLRLNAKKTKFIVFTTVNSNTDGAFDFLTLNGAAIDRVFCHNYLGLIIDSRLNWADHIVNVIKKISQFVGILLRIRKLVNMNVRNMLYFAYVQSHLVYLLPIWGGSPSTYIECICKLQNKILRIINFQPYRSRNVKCLYSSSIHPFRRLIDYETLLLIHKIKNGLLKNNVKLFSYYETSNRITRRSHQLRPPNFTMRLSQDSILYRGNILYYFCHII